MGHFETLRNSIAALALVVTLPAAQAATIDADEQLVAEKGIGCLAYAARRHGVPFYLALSIKYTESGARWGGPIVNVNTDGSRDIGVMQINTSNLPGLAPYGITTEAQLHNVCVNVAVGTWILGDNIRRFGLIDGVGRYNAVTPWKRVRYSDKVTSTLGLLVQYLKADHGQR